MKSIDEITEMAAFVTLAAANAELEKEEKMRMGTTENPGGAFTRWANAEPWNFTKHREYENRAARLIAVRLVLSTFEPLEFQRRLRAATALKPSLF